MTKKEKVWSIICSIGVILGLLGYFGIQPYWTKSDNNIDPEALAKQLAKHLPYQQDFAAKEAEIRELKDTIERLQKDPADELKQAALQALKEDDTKKAVEFLEKSAQSRTEKAEELTTQAAQDWIDIGKISFLYDTQKALSSYEKATTLDPSNPATWNSLGLILTLLGNLDEAQHTYEKVIELADENKTIHAVAYSNLGNIYVIRGELNKAEELYRQSLELVLN